MQPSTGTTADEKRAKALFIMYVGNKMRVKKTKTEINSVLY